MIRWMLLIFILLVLVNSATGIIQKVGLGRLPGDMNFRFLGRQFFVPVASAVLVTVLLFSTIKLMAWIFLNHSWLRWYSNDLQKFCAGNEAVTSGCSLVFRSAFV